MSSLRSTQLALSFQALAAHSGDASTARDGWGVAFYQGNDVALFREPVAASDSPLVQRCPSDCGKRLHFRYGMGRPASPQ